ncbi:MAG: S-adenosylmethionine:tRNA ribosyltransferase-isomerase, partial [Firmicutes bacterium]|nr:S-adenosylmethionine:tRNA ribosyltransferase-isomerase [Bacillota bacterium]
MLVKEFNYELPRALIAQEPLPRRDQSRLLVLARKGGPLEHRCFRDLGAYLRPGDVMILNDSRVLPARIFARRAKTGGK